MHTDWQAAVRTTDGTCCMYWLARGSRLSVLGWADLIVELLYADYRV